MISYGLWQRRFGGDSNIVGRQITLNEQPTTVIGVMPAEFRLAHSKRNAGEQTRRHLGPVSDLKRIDDSDAAGSLRPLRV